MAAQTHSDRCEKICAPLRFHCRKRVMPFIATHTEKQDGYGYPDGLKGEQISTHRAHPSMSNEHLRRATKDRPYARLFPLDQAFSIMSEEVKRGGWDGSLIDQLDCLRAEGICTQLAAFRGPKK